MLQRMAAAVATSTVDTEVPFTESECSSAPTVGAGSTNDGSFADDEAENALRVARGKPPRASSNWGAIHLAKLGWT